MVVENLYKQIVARANIPAKYKNVSFDNFDLDFIPENKPKVVKIIEYTSEFRECLLTGKSMYVYSDKPGAGKTMLAVCLLKEIAKQAALWFYNEEEKMPMLQYGVQLDSVFLPVYFADSAELVDSRFEEETSGDMAKARRADFLILDDVFNERDTEYALGEVAKIVNYRYSQGKPTIFTSNHRFDQIASERYGVKLDRVVDRLEEMCKEYRIVLESYKSYRQRGNE